MGMERALPPGQTKILHLFADAEDAGRQPSRAEIAEQLGYAFPSAVSKHVEALVRKGLFALDRDKKRNVRLTATGWAAIGRQPARATTIATDMPGVPVLGAIAAGTPIEAIEQADDHLTDLAPRPGRFALRVRGDSMINAGIDDGDYAVIQQGAPVAQRQIAAVIVEGEATLKRVVRSSDGIDLVAENPAYQTRHIPGPQAAGVQVVGPLLFTYRPAR
jgi:repressor LexA